MQINKVRVLVRTLLLALTLSACAWGQSAKPQTHSEAQAPATLRYADGQPIPEGYQLRSGPRKGLVISGAIIAGAGYGFAVLGAADASLADHTGLLLIPGAGPWLKLAAGHDPPKGPCPTGDGCSTAGPDYRDVAIVVDGIMQAVGAALLVTGLTTTRRYLERSDVSVSLVPATLGNGGYGLGAFGTF